MKKFIILASVAALCSCGGGKTEAETTETPAKTVKCDSVETVTIDSITGTQTFNKVLRCDSTQEAAK